LSRREDLDVDDIEGAVASDEASSLSRPFEPPTRSSNASGVPRTGALEPPAASADARLVGAAAGAAPRDPARAPWSNEAEQQVLGALLLRAGGG